MHTDICAAPGLARGRRNTVPGFSPCWSRGRRPPMTDASSSSPPDDRIEQRAAELLPEERTAGSADPQAQAEAILEESDERESDTEAAPSSFLERRTSAETVNPDDTTL
jgi:hypothetical protein